ncbi:MAG: efflux RND transporter periplasmic adaptor subunit [Candidatus Omnitrophota bacterium]
MNIRNEENPENQKPSFQIKAPAPEGRVPSPFKAPVKLPFRVPEKIKDLWFSHPKARWVVIVIVVGVLLLAVKMFSGKAKPEKMSLSETMKQQQQAAKDAPVAVKGFKVGRFNYEDSMNVLGTIKGSMELKLSFEIPGVISSINYKEGERYEEGALLVSLKQDDILLRLKRAQAAFNKAESQAKVTENEVGENEKLLKMGAIPPSTVEKKKLEMDAAKYEAEAQRLEMKANEAMLEKSNLYAPSSGMLGDLNVEEGENVSQSTLIGTHINTEFVYAEFGIVERDVQKITLGQKAKVFVDAYPDKTFEGVIENIAPQISGTSRTSTAKVRIENPEGLLMPGMFARVRIMLYSKKDALVVPTDAIQGGEGEKFVFIIKLPEGSPSKVIQPKVADAAMGGGLGAMAALSSGAKVPEKTAKAEKGAGKTVSEKETSKIEEGVAEKRPVTVGYTRTDYSQIDAGLTEGEIVVMTGFERLEDGKKIRLIETQEAEL